MQVPDYKNIEKKCVFVNGESIRQAEKPLSDHAPLSTALKLTVLKSVTVIATVIATTPTEQ